MMRRTGGHKGRLYVFVLLLAAGPAMAQTRGLPGYDFDDLSRALRRDLQPLLEAASHDTRALDEIIRIAALTPDSILRGHPALPAALWMLLARWGDSTFAGRAAALDSMERQSLVSILDRGAGIRYALAFPRTWQLAPYHSHALLLEDRTRTPLTSPPDRIREYGPRDLSRLPGVVPSSCASIRIPSSFLQRGITGRVVAELIIDSAGRIEGNEITVMSASHEHLGRDALRVLRSCEFSPGRLAGRAVRTRMRAPMDYAPAWVNLGWRDGNYIAALRLHLAAAQAGVDFIGSAVGTIDRDTAALRELLRLPSRLSIRQPFIATYAAVLEAAHERWGDRAFAAVLASMPIGVRTAVNDVWCTVGDWQERHALTAAALPPHPPRPPAEVDSIKGVIISDTTGLDRQPELVPGSCPMPVYPSAHRDAGRNGRAVLTFVIDVTGKADPASLSVVTASHPDFAAPSIVAALGCRFVPAVHQGRQIPIRVQQPINYTIAR